MAHVELRNINKKFRRHTALDDLSLDVGDGEFFVLLGPTGAGKTTTLRLIAGLDAPDSGSILIAGEDVGQWSAAERDVALVFQYYSLYLHYSVRENLEFPLKSRRRRFSADEIGTRVARAAQTLRIEHLLERKTDRLSGGEMQRVSIGRAIVRQPRLFLMDEPLSNLDAKLRELLRSELKELQLRLGATLVFVTHDQVEAMTMGDRIGVLRDGELVQVGTPYEVYNRPCNTFVASFVGAPAINLLEATLDDGRLIFIPGRFELPLDRSNLARIRAAMAERTSLRVGVRPEHVKLLDAGGLEGTVYGAENHGVETIVTIQIAERFVRATVPSNVSVALNQSIRFAFVQDKLHLFDSNTQDNLARA